MEEKKRRKGKRLLNFFSFTEKKRSAPFASINLSPREKGEGRIVLVHTSMGKKKKKKKTKHNSQRKEGKHLSGFIQNGISRQKAKEKRTYIACRPMGKEKKKKSTQPDFISTQEKKKKTQSVRGGMREELLI